MHYDLSPIAIRLKKCVIKLSILLLQEYNSLLNAKRLKKYVLMPLMIVCFVFSSFPDWYKAEKIFDKAVSHYHVMLKYS